MVVTWWSPGLQPGTPWAPRISDFTDCPCALPDGTALVGQSFVAIDPLNGSEVENHLSKMTLRSRRAWLWLWLEPR